MKIGLLGGSFNPPHLGHVHLSKLAIQKLKLKQLWWLPTLQNPFKQPDQYLPYTKRLSLCQKITKNQPKIICQNQPYYFTFLLVKKLQKKHLKQQFFLICGADCLAQMHKWQNFKSLAKTIQIVIFSRNILQKNTLLNAKQTKAYCLTKKTQLKMSIFFTKTNHLSASKIRNEKLIIINNEPIENMAIGLNSTLFYALINVSQGRKVYFLDLSKCNNFFDKTTNLLALKQDSALQLLNQYQNENNLLRHKAKQQQEHILSIVSQYFNTENLLKNITDQQELSQIFGEAKILNRLEPIKKPFPPCGSENFQQFLIKLQQKFGNIHCPINLSDKEYINNLSTPTAVLNTKNLWQNQQQIQNAFHEVIANFKKLYPYLPNIKIVVKPKDSAQSTGVFSIEFTNQTETINILNHQQYLASNHILQASATLQANFLINLLHKQCSQNNNPDSQQAIINVYGEEILLQPFLLGVKIGDFRTILLKNNQQQFYTAGTVFRCKITQPQTGFTTSATAGQSIIINADKYLKKLQPFINQVLQYLHENSQKYHNVHFMGLDFIAKTLDANEFYLGEMNMHCPGLISMLGESFDDACNIVLDSKQF